MSFIVAYFIQQIEYWEYASPHSLHKLCFGGIPLRSLIGQKRRCAGTIASLKEWNIKSLGYEYRYVAKKEKKKKGVTSVGHAYINVRK